MGYLLLDLELDEPLPPVALEPTQDGVGVLVRRAGIPIAWFMQALRPGAALTPAELSRLVAKEAGEAILRRALCTSRSRDDAVAVALSVTIAVCTRDRPEGLARLLDSMAALPATADEVKVELLVVDNASVDGSIPGIAAACGARYVREARPGLDFARNRAAREATGDWLIFFDDDVVVDPGWLIAFQATLTEHPDAAAVTGAVVPLALDTDAQVLFEHRGGFRTTFDLTRFQGTAPTDLTYPAGGGAFGTGANMAVRMDVLAALGGFDEALDTGPPLPGGGDLDLFQRVVRAGHVLVLEPGCLVFHEHRRDMAALYRQLGRSWGTSHAAMWSKAYRTDPALRPRLRRYLCLWFYSLARRLAHDVLRPGVGTTPRTTITEIVGAVLGLAGGYRRSQRRSANIRRRLR